MCHGSWKKIMAIKYIWRSFMAHEVSNFPNIHFHDPWNCLLMNFMAHEIVLLHISWAMKFPFVHIMWNSWPIKHFHGSYIIPWNSWAMKYKAQFFMENSWPQIRPWKLVLHFHGISNRNSWNFHKTVVHSDWIKHTTVLKDMFWHVLFNVSCNIDISPEYNARKYF